MPSRKSNNHRAEVTQCFLQSPICVLCSPEDSQPFRDPRFPSLQHCCMFMMFFQFVSLFLSSNFTFLCFCVSFLFIPLGSHVFFPNDFFSHLNHRISSGIFSFVVSCELSASINTSHSAVAQGSKKSTGLLEVTCENQKKKMFPQIDCQSTKIDIHKT